MLRLPTHLVAVAIAALLFACGGDSDGAGPDRDAGGDTATSDSGGTDAGMQDSGTSDTGTTDTGTTDTGITDTGGDDTGGTDTGVADVTEDPIVDPGTDPSMDVGSDTTADTGTDTGSPDTGGDTGTPDVGMPGELFVSDGMSYSMGPLTTTTVNVSSGDNGAPTDMFIVTPTAPGTYAVVVFQHGFLMNGAWYSEVLTHLASHGFVVVAPQMYAPDGLPVGKPSAVEEAGAAAEVHAWLPDNLSRVTGVTADFGALGVSGHSRGGKVNWLLLTSQPGLADAIALLDPVDGTGGPLGGEARAVDGTLPASIPTLIVGTGLGPVGGGGFSMACAPEGDNYVQFYGAAPTPAWQVVADDNGHNDMLDADPPGCGFTCTACDAGPNPDGMRDLAGGLLTAFFRGTLQGNSSELGLLTDEMAAPVNVTTTSR